MNNTCHALELIEEERKRQQVAEQFSDELDDRWTGGELAKAAACYAASSAGITHLKGAREGGATNVGVWPWAPDFDKRAKHADDKALVIAGALIVAEIERRMRLGENFDLDTASTAGEAGDE